MSAFDEVVYGAKKVFDAAAVKTNELYEASRIQIEKSQLNCRLRDEYEKLGKLCYKMSETGEDMTGQMKINITKIKGLLKDIELANENLNSKTRSRTCESCGFVVNSKYEFCPKCGKKL